jgi:hypothetical protein
VVAQVGGQVDVRVGASHLVEQEVARSPAQRDGAHLLVGVARDPHAVCGGREHVGHVVGELAERHRRRQGADPALPRAGSSVEASSTTSYAGSSYGCAARIAATTDSRSSRAGHDLDPHLVDHLELPDRADRGRGPVERAEPALPRRR